MAADPRSCRILSGRSVSFSREIHASISRGRSRGAFQGAPTTMVSPSMATGTA